MGSPSGARSAPQEVIKTDTLISNISKITVTILFILNPFNYGAGNYDRVKKAYWMCVKLSTALLLVMCALGMVFAEPLVWIFRDDPLVIALGAKAMRLQCVAFVLAGFTTMSNMMLQNIGKVFRASFLAVARQGIFFVPLVTFLPMLFGIDGVLWAQPLADLCAFAGAMLMHIPVLKSLGKKDN